MCVLPSSTVAADAALVNNTARNNLMPRIKFINRPKMTLSIHRTQSKYPGRASAIHKLLHFIRICFYILFFWCCCWRHRCRMMMALFGDSFSSPRSISNYHHHYHKHMEIMEWTIWNWNERIGLPPNAAAYSEDKKTKRKKKLNANSNDP